MLLVPYENKALALYQSLFAGGAQPDEAALEAAMQQLVQSMLPIYLGVAVLLILASQPSKKAVSA